MVLQSNGPMRTVAHPGALPDVRFRSLPVKAAAAISFTVKSDDDLLETVHRELDSVHARGASFILRSGTVRRLALMTGGAGRDGQIMSFYGPHMLSAPLVVVAGAAGSGVDEHGQRFSHCHAVFKDSDGRLVGGHLMAGETIAGTEGITLDLVPIAGGRFACQIDAETQFTIFHPEAE